MNSLDDPVQWIYGEDGMDGMDGAFIEIQTIETFGDLGSLPISSQHILSTL